MEGGLGASSESKIHGGGLGPKGGGLLGPKEGVLAFRTDGPADLTGKGVRVIYAAVFIGTLSIFIGKYTHQMITHDNARET